MRIYIASPYTGDESTNTFTSIKAADELLNLGFEPFVPLLSHFWDLLHPHPKERWLKWCLSWIEVCDALLRLPGDSEGADREVAHAERHGITVYYSVEALWNGVE